MTITADVVEHGSAAAVLSELLGCEVRPHGEQTIHCPFPDHHSNGDRTPSASVNAERGMVNCHACGDGWDVMQLVVALGHAPDAAGARRWLLARGYLPSNGHVNGRGPRADANGNAAPAHSDDEQRRVEQAQSFYRQSRAGLDWLALSADDAPMDAATSYGFDPRVLAAYGVGFQTRRVSRAGKTYPAALVWPIQDADGTVVAVKFRAVDELRKGEKKSTTLGPASRGFLGYDVLVDPARRGQPRVLCAGEKDTDRLAAALPDVVAISKATGEAGGLGPLPRLLADSDVVLLPDLDPAGTASVADGESLTAAGARVRVADLGPYLSGDADESDAADLVTKYGTAAPALLRRAIEASMAWSPEIPAPPLDAAQPDDPAAPVQPPTAEEPLRGDEYSDSRNAERFAARHEGEIRYATSHGWMVLRRGVWRRDVKDVLVKGLAQKFGKRVLREAVDDDDPARAVREAKRVRSAAGVEAMVTSARSVPGVHVRLEEFDQHPLLLNCHNGVVDLATAKLRPHDPALLMTRQVPIAFDPSATCPRWDRFLREVFVDERGETDHSLIQFAQRMAGYSATASTAEQILLFLLGSGSNGKSVLLSVLRRILGSYAASADPSSFLQSKHSERIRSDLARLHNVRLVVTAEPELGEVLAAALIKRITGGDEVVARFHYQPEFEFVFTGKLWFAANHAPRVRDDGEGLWRRVLVLPFRRTFAGSECDPHLLRELRAEAPGIFNWIVAGAREWHEHGLDAPAAVRTESLRYRSSQDRLSRFISESCELQPGVVTTSAVLFAAWCQWCGGYGLPNGTARSFGQRLSSRQGSLGIEKADSGRARGWSGIGLRPDPSVTFCDVPPQTPRERED